MVAGLDSDQRGGAMFPPSNPAYSPSSEGEMHF